MTKVHVFYHVLSSNSLKVPLQDILHNVPHYMHARALRYRSTLAAYNFIQGRSLLQHGITALGLPTDLHTLQISDNGKPTLSNVSFNISHSDTIVVCAFSSFGEIGVDIEVPSDKDIQHLKHSFTDKEWRQIQSDPLQLYTLWCRKEAILKAAELKLSQLHQIKVDAFLPRIKISDSDWNVQSLDFLQSHQAHGAICTALPIKELIVEQCHFDFL